MVFARFNEESECSKVAKVYFPDKWTMVPASPPHPPNTEYRVSVGTETWGGENHRVIKVHMVFDGKLAERRTPSFPIGTNDHVRVSEVVRRMSAGIYQ
jgi:hypothetical protein